MKTIQLTKGKQAIVDDEDFEYISKYKWQYGARGYAVKNIQTPMKDGKRISKMMWMHREILKTPKGYLTDHINGDKLDNRKENLRIVTAEQNTRNSKIPSHNTSGFKGVSEVNRNLKNKWESYITVKDKKIHLGYFPSKESAAEVYNNAAKDIFGEYAKLNNLTVFEYEYYSEMEMVRQHIKNCESLHTQQAIYSTFHDGLTQVCFGCKKVRSTLINFNKLYED